MTTKGKPPALPKAFGESEHEHFRRVVDADKLDREITRRRQEAQEARILTLELKYRELEQTVRDIAAIADIPIRRDDSGGSVHHGCGSQPYDA